MQKTRLVFNSYLSGEIFHCDLNIIMKLGQKVSSRIWNKENYLEDIKMEYGGERWFLLDIENKVAYESHLWIK